MKDLELFENFFQESNSYYLEKLELFENGKKISINYSAFLLGIFWFLYRKLYVESAIIILIFYLQAIIENHVLIHFFVADKLKVYSLAFNVLVLVFLSFAANFIYLKKAKKIVENIKRNYGNIDEQKKILNKKGGTNIVVPIIFLIISIIATALS